MFVTAARDGVMGRHKKHFTAVIGSHNNPFIAVVGSHTDLAPLGPAPRGAAGQA
jgi:hypothetical protein